MYVSGTDVGLLAEMLAAISVKIDHVKFREADEENGVLAINAEERSIFDSALSNNGFRPN